MKKKKSDTSTEAEELELNQNMEDGETNLEGMNFLSADNPDEVQSDEENDNEEGDRNMPNDWGKKGEYAFKYYVTITKPPEQSTSGQSAPQSTHRGYYWLGIRLMNDIYGAQMIDYKYIPKS